MPASQELIDLICNHQPQAASAVTDKLLVILHQRYGKALRAILFYGSCLRHKDHFEGLLDLYLIVDSYENTYPEKKLLQFGNALLPPNVFYLESELDNTPIRAKYAILSLNDFIRGTRHWFHPYLWGRFAQPVTILYTSSKTVTQHLNQVLAQAVLTFVKEVAPVLPPTFTAREFWSRGFDLSYGTELRPERPGQGERLYLTTSTYYDELLEIVLKICHFPATITTDNPLVFQTRIPTGYCRRGRRAWQIRPVIGKTFSLLRLLKAFFTFHGGVNYICWKIERHSHLNLSLPDGRQHNFFTLTRTLWRSWRQCAFR
jgi:hypothetical protein